MMTQIKKNNLNIGVISDTHGLLRPEIITAFSNIDHILHAGDIGNREILEQLEKIAPVLSVLGNTDNPMAFLDLYDSVILTTNLVSIYMVHNINCLDLDPKTSAFNVVVYGHSHKPSIEVKNGVLYLNPGSAGPKRFSLPVSAAILSIKGSTVYARFIDLSLPFKSTPGYQHRFITR